MFVNQNMERASVMRKGGQLKISNTARWEGRKIQVVRWARKR
jgi:hypothetical protein